ncbi:MAG: glycosyltransferase family 39 protein [Pseudanabaena sp. M57BS1SP1A06MG]|nr:glycosyltransferase family 39 protein [Pseudanabaena sp. M53BS1SP1A06MG]MCA6584484.1 glycosyltransferase family 39 protein [Pseudanabaena sp. M34BS1SP1A06MG]MCA6591275.1 glycosyltransferase family 39 protein [Pseudanabaena sp. M38BS1SP1A06MG]MCA6601373.1 glycosyltransferase family 39 protein [Pseudanabaena sp. M57BS1SP1A06MG]
MKINKWAIAILLWGFLFRATSAIYLNTGFDEAYYYLYTQNLDWSYFDHPPLVALTTGIGVWLTGAVTPFTIRIGSVLFYTGTLIFSYLTSKRLFGDRAATLTLGILTTIPIFQIAFGILTLPDNALMFFWSASLYVAATEFFPSSNLYDDKPYQPTYRLAIIAILVGLAFLGKYHGVILGGGLVLFCLLSPRHRCALFSIWTLAAITLFTITISPVLFWNAQHEFASFRFQSGRAVPSQGYNFEGLLVTFLVALGYLFPTFGFPLWWTSFRTLGELVQFSNRRLRGIQNEALEKENLDLELLYQKRLLILCISMPIFCGFTFMGGFIQILPSWHMPGFFGATLLLGERAALIQIKRPKFIRNWLWGSGIVILPLLLIGLLHVHMGLAQKGGDAAIAGGFWEAKDDPSTQMIDILQLRQAFVDSPKLKEELQKADFVFSNSFFVAGQVGMAIEPLGKKVTCFDSDLRGFAYWSKAQEFVGKTSLFISSEQFMKDERFPDPLAKYQDYFQSLEKLADIHIKRGGQTVQIFPVYRTSPMLKPYPRPYG